MPIFKSFSLVFFVCVLCIQSRNFVFFVAQYQVILKSKCTLSFYFSRSLFVEPHHSIDHFLFTFFWVFNDLMYEIFFKFVLSISFLYKIQIQAHHFNVLKFRKFFECWHFYVGCHFHMLFIRKESPVCIHLYSSSLNS